MATSSRKLLSLTTITPRNAIKKINQNFWKKFNLTIRYLALWFDFRKEILKWQCKNPQTFKKFRGLLAFHPHFQYNQGAQQRKYRGEDLKCTRQLLAKLSLWSTRLYASTLPLSRLQRRSRQPRRQRWFSKFFQHILPPLFYLVKDNLKFWGGFCDENFSCNVKKSVLQCPYQDSTDTPQTTFYRRLFNILFGNYSRICGSCQTFFQRRLFICSLQKNLQ